ncbi:redoxin domain-containing protein [bacterium]|nr:redoxin domain-containing protein [bacterium]
MAASVAGCSGKEASAAGAPSALVDLAKPVDNFQLVDHNRKAHELGYYRYAPAIVLVSQTNGSETSRAAAAALADLKAAYADKGVLFYMLNSSLEDDRDAVVAEMASLGVDLPVLMDEQQLVGEQLGVARDGEAFVIQPKTMKIAYHGPIDDRFMKAKPKLKARVKTAHVADTLDALLAGAKVEPVSLTAPGATIAFPERDNKASFQSISYEKEVAPIIQAKCVTCHQAGGIGPFAMTSYEVIKGFAPMIRETIRTDRMPPYFADPHIGTFKEDQSLSGEEIKTLVHWIEAGAPRGTGSDPLADHVTVASDWPAELGPPDYIVDIPAFEVPATGIVEYQYPTIKNPFKEDKWLRAVSVKPGDLAVVHHVTSSHIKDGESQSMLPGGSVGSYTPGAQAQVMADGWGAPIPAGGAYRFSMHYTTTGKVATDATKVGFWFHDKTPEFIKRSAVISDFALEIPAGAQRHEETAYLEFPADAILYTLYPHAHLRGQNVELEALYPDGKREILLSLPKYDFNWQRDYDLVEPLRIPAGTKLIAHWVYDNSVHNRANPDPQSVVKSGLQTHEEMMYFRVNYRWVDETSSNVRNDLQTELVGSVMRGALDDNQNGKIELAELRGRALSLKDKFPALDTDGDGALNAAEFEASGFARRTRDVQQED